MGLAAGTVPVDSNSMEPDDGPTLRLGSLALPRRRRHPPSRPLRGARHRETRDRLSSESMARTLSRKVPLAELHCHLGGAVTPAIMWGIAHAQGIKLPTKDYWEFRDMITVSHAAHQELRRLPAAVPLDRAHPELAARRRARGLRGRRRRLPQEQRHDDGAPLQPDEAEPRRRAGPRPHHRGRGPRHGQGDPRVPGQARAHLLPRPRVPLRAQRDHREKAIAWRDRGVVGIDIAGPESATFRVADYRRLFRRARQFGLGSPSTLASPARSTRSPGSSSCSSPTASAMASRRPTTPGRWR